LGRTASGAALIFKEGLWPIGERQPDTGEADIKTPYGFTAHVTEYAAWRIGPMTSGTGPYELEALLNTPLLIGCTTLSDK
jgi:hypothetical protein